MPEKPRHDGGQRHAQPSERVRRKLSRRSFLANSAIVGGGALALSASGTARASGTDQATTTQDDGCGLQEPRRADEPAPEMQEFLRVFAENAEPIHTLSTEEARQAYQSLFVEDVSPEEAGNTVGNVENREIPGPDDNRIPIRIYTPAEGQEPYPAMVYFHGGGWVLGGLDTHDSVARSLTNSSGAMMVSVDYRLGPENPFPAAVRDAFAATRWVIQNAAEIGADPERVAIGGESAGGNLSTVTALQMRDADVPSLAHQLLVYPVGTLAPPFLFPEDRGVENPYIVAEDAAWFGERYLPYPEAATNAYTSPLYYANSLSDLPPATVMTTGFGIWRDQSFALAERLCNDGVDVEAINYPNVIHDVMNMEVLPDPFPDVPQSKQLFEDAGERLRNAFGM